MATYAQMKDDIFVFMDDTYSRIESVYNPRGFRNRHIDGMTIYAYLSGRFPDESISKCYTVVSDVQDFCMRPESVYPFPDGEYWTVSEVERYLEWRDREK